MCKAFTLCASLSLLVGACGGQEASPYEPPEPGEGGPDSGSETGEEPENRGCNQMDFLFVIDNSGSMGQEQENLAANLPNFINLIDQYQTKQGFPLDYRVAVTTAGRDVQYTIKAPAPFDSIPVVEGGDNGEMRQDCGMTRRWMERGDPNLTDTFACVSNVGVSGPGAEMPLLGMEWSLSKRVEDGTNAGFLRDDALLAMVFVTDQDDCSRDDDGFTVYGDRGTCFNPEDEGIIALPHYLSFLDSLKGNRMRWASAIVAGTEQDSCSSTFGDAAEAVRMLDFADQAGDNTIVSSICEGDLTVALAEAVEKFEEACNTFPPVD
jgi:hypothetical protein